MRVVLTLCLLAAAVAVAQVNPSSLGWTDFPGAFFLSDWRTGNLQNYADSPQVALLKGPNATVGQNQLGVVPFSGSWSNTTPVTMRNLGPCTFGGWVYRVSANAGTVIFQNDRDSSSAGYSFSVSRGSSPGGNGLVITLQASGLSYQRLASNISVPLNKWAQVVYVATNSSMTGICYLNGEQVTTGGGAFNTPTSLSYIYIGGASQPTNTFALDFYWPYAFSPAQVRDLYNSQLRLLP